MIVSSFELVSVVGAVPDDDADVVVSGCACFFFFSSVCFGAPAVSCSLANRSPTARQPPPRGACNPFMMSYCVGQ